MSVPIIAIVGRPNVGKSTLFNRLLRGRRAIVDDTPGVTRDRLYGEFDWRGRRFILVDTGGYEPHATGIMALVRAQARQAVAEADAILLLVDGKEGLTPADAEVAGLLRKFARCPILLVVNKVDAVSQEALTAEFHRLGFSPVFSVSAEQGQGIGELLDAVASKVLESEPPPQEADAITVAVIGRPNVGKSSLVNRILGADRVLVSPEPGTTRDAVDTRFSYRGRDYILVDTAGIRAKGRIGRSVERYSVSRALAAVRRADVALILLDGVEGAAEQDTKIAGEALEAGCASILVVNKWDRRAGEGDAEREYRLALQEKFKYLAFAPIAFVSALTGDRVMHLFRLIDAVAAERERRIPTPELNTVIQEAVTRRPPPAERGRPVHIRYATQVGIKPPRFLCFATAARGLHFSYLRYLENCLRQAYGFRGTPIRLVIRGRS
ncbi:MAG: ribosome biogenesis GTPase Der [candidate division NC10 bacterium RIFCSPLOWO2_12_FULL_66_18]|nr:MAG: ribosome biogenesis GTPase Der [candidate division NC10 bacterium RIFCSPLOWO2_02_FULL_66_22]OGB95574.1 MAG: ribosome biogenesis GTPase Der [candidate division NC10 bacterium RIFCSPLOWO2_12_FULL_66_18]